MSTTPIDAGAHLDGGVLRACVPAGPSVEAVELCLPGPGGERRIELGRSGDGWWRGSADRVAPGDPYGLARDTLFRHGNLGGR